MISWGGFQWQRALAGPDRGHLARGSDERERHHDGRGQPGRGDLPPHLVRRPDLLSLDEASAKNRITDAGLTVGAVSLVRGCGRRRPGPGPVGGDEVSPRTPVSKTVSTGTDASGNPCMFE